MNPKNGINSIVFCVCVALAACLLPGLVGCSSATNTGYQVDAVPLAALQAASAAWNSYHASHAIDAATEAKAQSLFASTKAAYAVYVDATEVAVGVETNSQALSQSAANAALTQAVSDLTAFLKTLNIQL